MSQKGEHLAKVWRKTALSALLPRHGAVSNSSTLGIICTLATACRHLAGRIARSKGCPRSPEGRPHLSRRISVRRISAKQGSGELALTPCCPSNLILGGLGGPSVRPPSPPPGCGVFRGPQQAKGEAQGSRQAEDHGAASEGPYEEVHAGSGVVAGGAGRQGSLGRTRSVGCHAAPGRRGDSCANPPPPRLATHCNGQTHATLGEGVGLQADGQGPSFSHGAWLAMPPRRRIASARSPERCPSDGLPTHPGNRGAQALAGFAPIIGCEYASAATHEICGGGQIDYVKGPRTELCKMASFVRNRVSKLTSAIEAPSTESAWVRPRSSQ